MNAPALTIGMKDHLAYCDKITAGVDLSALSDEEQWHFRRRLGLGGSEAGTVLGLNKYQTPWDLWAIKTGRAAAPDLSGNMAVKMGHKLEQTVAELYCEVTGYTVRRSNVHHIHKDKPWLVGNLDRVIVGEKRGLECKTASGFAAKKGGFGKGNVYDQDGALVIECDEVPDTYLIQVQHYMAVTGLPVFDLAVLIDGRDFRVFTIHRNDDLIAELEDQLTTFWFDNVIADIAPEGEAIQEVEPVSGSSVEASGEIAALLSERCEIAEAMDELEHSKKAIDEKVKSFMGEAEILTCHGAKLATWKASETTRFDSTAFKKAEPAIWQQYANTTTVRTLRIAS